MQFNSQCILFIEFSDLQLQSIPNDFNVKNKVTELLEKSGLADKRPKGMDGDEFFKLGTSSHA